MEQSSRTPGLPSLVRAKLRSQGEETANARRTLAHASRRHAAEVVFLAHRPMSRIHEVSALRWREAERGKNAAVLSGKSSLSVVPLLPSMDSLGACAVKFQFPES